MRCLCLHILQAIRFEQISFLASCSDHSGEEPGSGLEQCTLCVSRPQVVKCFSSFSSDLLLAVLFHVNVLEGGRNVYKGVCLRLRPLQHPSEITGGSLQPWACLAFCMSMSVGVCGAVCGAGAPVTQGHSCETPLIPLLRVF